MVEEQLLAILGIIVVEVPGLDVEVCYVSDRRVALIRAGLPERALRRCHDWLLETVPEAA
ncbi:hypothetical protein [Cellulomonas shaoxiangyii]|uniref:hypothetical protein n=1 Tax=Cellulomonas shaoxiangyii TaxID=2566013 RepID=UPI0010941A66|nr:hypothetical protein [Cellulomonas shaoxiangyii]TGY75719.1 hypothetical protein E5226_17800 [Cellulomonas shaoxiangyii]